ncbi:MAG: OmpA family protein [Sedimentitalea sp.]
MTNKLTAAIAFSGLVALSACTDPASLTGDGVNKNTFNGALLGGVIGAGVTAVTGGDTKNVATAAAVGAVAGGLVGNHLDKQAAALRAQLGNEDITVTNTGEQLVVSLPQDITFDTDSSAVRAGLRTDLNTVARNLQDYPNSRVQVVGHTDSEGEADYNLALSQRRASSVADVLQADGVTFDRLLTTGRGEAQPLASNLTPEGRAQNRRVEIVVVPNA